MSHNGNGRCAQTGRGARCDFRRVDTHHVLLSRYHGLVDEIEVLLPWQLCALLVLREVGGDCFTYTHGCSEEETTAKGRQVWASKCVINVPCPSLLIVYETYRGDSSLHR